jgi:hypothetical protein
MERLTRFEVLLFATRRTISKETQDFGFQRPFSYPQFLYGSVHVEETKMFRSFFLLVALSVAVFAQGGSSGNTVNNNGQSSSDKVFLAHNNLGQLDPNGNWSSILTGHIKTSRVGAILAQVSSECAVLVDPQAYTYWGGYGYDALQSHQSDSDFAVQGVRILVRVLIDGVPAEPNRSDATGAGGVTFCDKVKGVYLAGSSYCYSNNDCDTEDYRTVGVFDATKSAHHFNFYLPNLKSTAYTHRVDVQAKLECFSYGGYFEDAQVNIPGPGCNTANNGYGPLGFLGFRSLVLENVQNGNLFPKKFDVVDPSNQVPMIEY